MTERERLAKEYFLKYANEEDYEPDVDSEDFFAGYDAALESCKLSEDEKFNVADCYRYSGKNPYVISGQVGYLLAIIDRLTRRDEKVRE